MIPQNLSEALNKIRRELPKKYSAKYDDTLMKAAAALKENAVQPFAGGLTQDQWNEIFTMGYNHAKMTIPPTGDHIFGARTVLTLAQDLVGVVSREAQAFHFFENWHLSPSAAYQAARRGERQLKIHGDELRPVFNDIRERMRRKSWKL